LKNALNFEMSSKKCVVRQCRDAHENSSDKENGITLFGVPKNFVDKWKDAIPYLSKSSHVCSRHFDESDIEKGKEILNVFHPFVRWQLKPGSYPKRMLLDSDYPQELKRKRAGGSDQLTKKLSTKKRKVLTDLVQNTGKQGNLATYFHQTCGSQDKYQQTGLSYIYTCIKAM
jgi:hypothetical protein